MNDSPPLVSFLVNSFNRLALLQNLFRSFEICCERPDIEWVISDFGSTDGSREFIEQLSTSKSFDVRYAFEDENAYFDTVRAKGLPVDTPWRRKVAILGRFKNKLDSLVKTRFEEVPAL